MKTLESLLSPVCPTLTLVDPQPPAFLQPLPSGVLGRTAFRSRVLKQMRLLRFGRSVPAAKAFLNPVRANPQAGLGEGPDGGTGPTNCA